MNALIGALRVSLSAETAQFEAGMKRAQRTANQTRSQFQKAFGGLGGIVKAGFAGVVTGLSIGLITQGVKAALDYAGSLKEVSQQLGVTTKDLQVFRYAAGQLGVSQNELERGLQRLTVTLGKVEAGAKAPAKALAAIGISADQLKGKDTGEAFRVIADGLEKVTDRSQRAAVEVALFGREGAKLDTLLSGGSAQINELSLAAEKLGIVLSDEQIQRADDTADKLDALKTVLSARVAGVVADNADSIYKLADSLIYLVAQAGDAIGKINELWRTFAINRARQVAAFPTLNKVLFGTKGSAAILRAGAAAIRGNIADKTPKAAPVSAPRSSGADIGQFLKGGGGGGKAKRGPKDTSLRDAFQFDQDLLRAQMDVVRAQQQLATDYSERAALSIQLLNLEQEAFKRGLEYEVAAGELTKAQAAQLEAEFVKRDALERQAVLAEEEAQRKEDYNRLDQLDFDLQRDILRSQEQLADTAAEQRAIRLRLLDLDYRAERARLETILADEQASYAAKEEARRRLANLNRTQANDTNAVIRDTAGPFEQAQMQFGDLSEEMENLRVNGIMAAGDALATLATEGFGSFKEQAISAIKAVIAEFIRLQTIKFLFNLLGSAAGAPGAGAAAGGSNSLAIGYAGLPGFATGGGFNVMGHKGIDKNVLQLNGLPIAKVSHGERVSISNDNQRMGVGGTTINMSFSGPVSRETMMQAGAKVRMAVASANRKGA